MLQEESKRISGHSCMQGSRVAATAVGMPVLTMQTQHKPCGQPLHVFNVSSMHASTFHTCPSIIHSSISPSVHQLVLSIHRPHYTYCTGLTTVHGPVKCTARTPHTLPPAEPPPARKALHRPPQSFPRPPPPPPPSAVPSLPQAAAVDAASASAPPRRRWPTHLQARPPQQPRSVLGAQSNWPQAEPAQRPAAQVAARHSHG